MYKDFYHLSRNPFEITPDPYFFFPTPAHKEALAILYHGVRNQKGFVLLTGEVGTGKTLLLRCLLDALAQNQIAFSYVFNPRLSPLELFHYVMEDFGLNHHSKSKAEMLVELNRFLIGRHAQELATALILDEGQLLSCDLLEEIRLLTNLETAQKKLLQIVLVGQAELDRQIDLPQLRQLRQRIALRCRLVPLTERETQSYVQTRLELGGANSNASAVFSQAAIAEVFRYSRGIPRVINTICENALVAGFAREARCITPEIVVEVVQDLGLPQTDLNADFAVHPENHGRQAALAASIDRGDSQQVVESWAHSAEEAKA